MFTYKLMIYFGLTLGIIFLIMSIIFFVKLNIFNIIIEVTGLSSKRKIEKIHSGNTRISNNHYNLQMNVRKNIKDISISDKLNNMNTYSSDLYNSNKLDNDNFNENIQKYRTNNKAENVLSDNMQTDILEDYITDELENDTEVLEDNNSSVQNIKDIYFKVVINKLEINTYEIID